MATVPSSKGFSSNMPIGPFQTMVLPFECMFEDSDGLNTNVEAHQTGICKSDWDRLSRIQRIVRIDDLMIGRQDKLDARVFCHLLDLKRLWHHIVLDERFADREALSLKKRVCHRSADEQLVHFAFDERFDDRDLVRDLGAAKDNCPVRFKSAPRRQPPKTNAMTDAGPRSAAVPRANCQLKLCALRSEDA